MIRLLLVLVSVICYGWWKTVEFQWMYSWALEYSTYDERMLVTNLVFGTGVLICLTMMSFVFERRIGR